MHLGTYEATSRAAPTTLARAQRPPRELAATAERRRRGCYCRGAAPSRWSRNEDASRSTDAPALVGFEKGPRGADVEDDVATSPVAACLRRPPRRRRKPWTRTFSSSRWKRTAPARSARHFRIRKCRRAVPRVPAAGARPGHDRPTVLLFLDAKTPRGTRAFCTLTNSSRSYAAGQLKLLAAFLALACYARGHDSCAITGSSQKPRDSEQGGASGLFPRARRRALPALSIDEPPPRTQLAAALTSQGTTAATTISDEYRASYSNCYSPSSDVRSTSRTLPMRARNGSCLATAWRARTSPSAVCMGRP